MERSFREPLPPKETPEEKRARLKRERQQADAFLRFRMDVIAETYSVHLKDLYLNTAMKEFLKHCGKELERVRKRQRELEANLKGDHFLKVDVHNGEVEDVVNDSPSKKPHHFYRTTKVASWRIYRHHHEKYGHQPQSTGYRRVSFVRPVKKPEELCPFSDYLHMVTDMMAQTAKAQEHMGGRTRAGSLLMLTPFERYKFKSELASMMVKAKPDNPYRVRRINVPAVKGAMDRLVAQKLEERDEDLCFKGRRPKQSKTSKFGPQIPDDITESEVETVDDRSEEKTASSPGAGTSGTEEEDL